MERLIRDHGARRALLSRWLWLALLPALVASVSTADGLPHWLEVITTDLLKGDVGFLASDELNGRAVLSPGSRTAAAFVASRFQALGLQPAGEGARDWYQQVPLVRTPVQSGFCRVERRDGDGAILQLTWGADFRCRPMGARGIDVSGKAVFAGYGIHAPEQGHDDYADLTVKNRVVVLLAGGPPARDEADTARGLAPRRHTSVWAKRDAAASRGAAALVVLPRPGTANQQASVHPNFWPDHLAVPDEKRAHPDCPAILLEAEAADRLTAIGGFEAEPGSGGPHPLSGVRITCRLAMDNAEPVSTRNVLALVPGSDELYFREFVVVSAHYDHLGRRGDQLIFPGADDNASGVAALLSAARAFAELPAHRRPARSVLFVAWAGEERGFLGSEHFLAQPTVPRGQIRAMINIDMVGRNNDDDPASNNSVLAIYSAQAPGFEPLLDEAAGAAGLDLRLRPRVDIGPSSDHMVFHHQGIPAVHFFSGSHPDLHRPGDSADKLNYDKLQRVARTAAGLAFLLADEPDPLTFDDSITSIQGRNDPF